MDVLEFGCYLNQDGNDWHVSSRGRTRSDLGVKAKRAEWRGADRLQQPRRNHQQVPLDCSRYPGELFWSPIKF